MYVSQSQTTRQSQHPNGYIRNRTTPRAHRPHSTSPSDPYQEERFILHGSYFREEMYSPKNLELRMAGGATSVHREGMVRIMGTNCHSLFVYCELGDSVRSPLFLCPLFSYNLCPQIPQHLPPNAVQPHIVPNVLPVPSKIYSCTSLSFLGFNLLRVLITDDSNRNALCARIIFCSTFRFEQTLAGLTGMESFWRGGACGISQLFVCDVLGTESTRCKYHFPMTRFKDG